jgi:hypothetical protein
MHDTKHCGFCGEEIKSVALKCRYCGETVDAALRAAEEAKQMVRDQARVGRDSPIIVSNNNAASSAASAAAVAVVPRAWAYRRWRGPGIIALGFSMFVVAACLTSGSEPLGAPGVIGSAIGLLSIPVFFVGVIVTAVQCVTRLFGG